MHALTIHYLQRLLILHSVRSASPTHQVADGLRALAVLAPLRLQRRLQADALLLQAQLAALQHAALVLQLAAVGLQLLQLLAALRLGFAEPRRRLRLGPEQRVGLLQLSGDAGEATKTDRWQIRLAPLHLFFLFRL